jgi:hypothetical protein
MRADQDLVAMRQRLFQNLLGNQQKEKPTRISIISNKPALRRRFQEDATLKQQQFFRARSTFLKGSPKTTPALPEADAVQDPVAQGV